jgi:hypothetical protein
MMQPIAELPVPSSNYHQLGIIREMLEAIETTTVAGQRYVMSKVVAFLHDQVGRCLTLPGSRRRVVAKLLEELEGQAERMVPDVRAFNGGAEIVMGVLAATTTMAGQPRT